MTKCNYCGKEITKKSHHKEPRKYCCLECYKAARGVKSYGTAICMWCGKEFKETRDRPNKFCSNKCSAFHKRYIERLEKAWEKETNPETLKDYQETIEILKDLEYRLIHERRCSCCGKWFTPKDTGRKNYCSENCYKDADRIRRDKRLARNGKPDSTITLTKVYMRDGGICQICGRQIDFDCDSNSDDYPSIDHIKPLAKGGLHRWDNVQLACRRCNTLKSDKWEE